MRVHALRTALAAAAFAAGTAHAVVPLPRLKVDPAQVTVSGLSSGGFMANQLGYAYSSTFKGVGVFAGGPYMCAGHNNYTACMYNATISSAMLSTMQTDINNWSGTNIDAKSNVANQKVFLWVGSSDTTVGLNAWRLAKLSSCRVSASPRCAAISIASAARVPFGSFATNLRTVSR